MRAIICGAGIAGLSLAQRLTTRDWDVVVLEKSPGPRSQGYMMDFFGLGYDAAESMGLLPRLRELSYEIREVTYLDESGRRRAGLDYNRFAGLVDGRLLSIMRPDLELALREQVAGRIDLRFGCAATHIDNSADGVRVTLDDGSVLDGDLLVGADGIHSTVRHLVFGPEQRFLRYLGFHTAAYIFGDPQIYQHLNNRFALTDSTDRQMGFYGLRDGSVAVFAVHRAPDPAIPDDTRTELRRVYSSLGWITPRALAKCPDSSELYYDQVAQIEIPQWSRDRVTLLGDSCQAVSLLGGQGASLAVAGAYVLGEQLMQADSVDAALRRYAELWQPVITEKQQAARRGAEWFLPSSSLRLRLRRVFLRLMNIPALGRYFGNALTGKSTVSVEDLSRGNQQLPTA